MAALEKPCRMRAGQPGASHDCGSLVPKADEQERRARWDLLALDIERRADRLRQSKRYKPRRSIVRAIMSLLAVGAAIGVLLPGIWKIGDGPADGRGNIRLPSAGPGLEALAGPPGGGANVCSQSRTMFLAFRRFSRA